MAVVQISRIQARRGLQEDLPSLASAELGWSVDSRRLFIGNGTLAEGAPTEGVTEVLTSYTPISEVLKSYIFRGNAGGYTAQTGTSLSTPTVRSYQDKLDDFVSVKDFGAVGDGVTDDTDAINRAIVQIYKSTLNATSPEVRRTIYFPAGTYVITGDTVLVPPYAHIVGDGISSTFIKQTDSTQNSCMQLTDSLFQIGAQLGQNSAVLPTDITVENLTFQQTSDKDVCNINSGTHLYFNNVGFIGSLNNPTTAGSIAYAGVRVESFATTTNNVNFTNCKFSNTRYAVLSDDAGKNVRLSNCYFSGLYKGIRLGLSSTTDFPNTYRILNCLFDSVANIAIDCYAGVHGVLSSGNSFNDVGSNFTNGVIQQFASIYFEDDSNYSLGDSFYGKSVTQRVTPVNSRSTWLESNLGLTLGSSVTGTGGNIALTDNIGVAANTGVVLTSTCTLNYSMYRGSAYRSGSIQYATNGATAYFMDNYVSTDDTGVVLSIVANSVNYTTTSTGTNATFRYNINYFN